MPFTHRPGYLIVLHPSHQWGTPPVLDRPPSIQHAAVRPSAVGYESVGNSSPRVRGPWMSLFTLMMCVRTVYICNAV